MRYCKEQKWRALLFENVEFLAQKIIDDVNLKIENKKDYHGQNKKNMIFCFADEKKDKELISELMKKNLGKG